MNFAKNLLPLALLFSHYSSGAIRLIEGTFPTPKLAVSFGAGDICVVDYGEVQCFTRIGTPLAIDIPKDLYVTDVVGGDNLFCFRTREGTAFCRKTAGSKAFPFSLSELTHVTQVASSADQVCIADSKEGVQCYLFEGVSASRRHFPEITDVTLLAVGGRGFCARHKSTVTCVPSHNAEKSQNWLARPWMILPSFARDLSRDAIVFAERAHGITQDAHPWPAESLVGNVNPADQLTELLNANTSAAFDVHFERSLVCGLRDKLFCSEYRANYWENDEGPTWDPNNRSLNAISSVIQGTRKPLAFDLGEAFCVLDANAKVRCTPRFAWNWPHDAESEVTISPKGFSVESLASSVERTYDFLYPWKVNLLQRTFKRPLTNVEEKYFVFLALKDFLLTHDTKYFSEQVIPRINVALTKAKSQYGQRSLKAFPKDTYGALAQHLLTQLYESLHAFEAQSNRKKENSLEWSDSLLTDRNEKALNRLLTVREVQGAAISAKSLFIYLRGD